MLIAEELFLLLRRDDGNPESMSAQRTVASMNAAITTTVIFPAIAAGGSSG